MHTKHKIKRISKVPKNISLFENCAKLIFGKLVLLKNKKKTPFAK